MSLSLSLAMVLFALSALLAAPNAVMSRAIALDGVAIDVDMDDIAELSPELLLLLLLLLLWVVVPFPLPLIVWPPSDSKAIESAVDVTLSSQSIKHGCPARVSPWPLVVGPASPRSWIAVNTVVGTKKMEG